MDIIPADKSHIRDIVALNSEVQQVHLDLFPHHFKATDPDELAAHYESWMSEDNFKFYLARDNGEPVGYVICVIIRKPDNPFSYGRSFVRIDQICVTENMRGRGIGRALIERAKELAQSQGIDTLEIAYWTANEAAGEMYRKCGFVTHSERMSMNVDVS